MKRERGGNDTTSHDVVNCNAGITAPLDVCMEALTHPNFEELARQFPAFGTAYQTISRRQQSLAAAMTQEFSITLSKALLHVHFHVSLCHVPIHQLCPPVPNRYFFARWIQTTLLPMMNSNLYFERIITPTDKTTTGNEDSFGLDIGTGAIAIYPLLLCASSTNCYMYGTDIDAASIQSAQQNVYTANPRLTKQIISITRIPSSTRQQQQQHDAEQQHFGPLYQSIVGAAITQPLDFCMTNPPFFDLHVDDVTMVDTTNQEQRQFVQHKSRNDGRANTPMTTSEGIYPDGEVGFVIDILLDGIKMWILQKQQQQSCGMNCNELPPPKWMCTMCGKKSSFIQLKHVLEQLLGVSHVTTTEFGPGKLMRWFIAWTFHVPASKSMLAVASSSVPHTSKAISTTTIDVPVSSILQQLQTCAAATENAMITCCCNNHNQQRGLVDEVARRISAYITDSNDPAFMHAAATTTTASSVDAASVEICMDVQSTAVTTNSNDGPWLGDEALPNTVRNAIPHSLRGSLLPKTGHYCMDIKIQYRCCRGCVSTSSRTQRETTTTIPNAAAMIQIHILPYAHSPNGKKAIEKFKLQMPGEVCRTNRKWRRKLKFETAVKQNAVSKHDTNVTNCIDGGGGCDAGMDIDS